MGIYLINIPAKFHSDLIWNYGVLGSFEDSCSNKKNGNNKTQWQRQEVGKGQLPQAALLEWWHFSYNYIQKHS